MGRVTINERIEARRRERRVLTRVSRAAWRLEQAGRERTWALVSARAEGISIRTLATAAGLSPSRVHQLVAAADLDALDAMLHVRGRSTDDRPPELLSGDLDTPLGNVLIWLHRNLVMDVTERASPGAGSGGVGSGESDSAAGEGKSCRRTPHADPSASCLADRWSLRLPAAGIVVARARTAWSPGLVIRRLPGWADSAYGTIVTVRRRAWGQVR